MSHAVVVDYGLGNLRSVANAVASLGAEAEITSDPGRIMAAERVIIPGVGAFGDGMKNLRERCLIEPLRQRAAADRPILGICLGMQLLFSWSEEFGKHEGLDVIPGEVRAIPPDVGLKVPHVGWSAIYPEAPADWSTSILRLIDPGTPVYFVHSFSAIPQASNDELAFTPFGNRRLVAAARRGKISGCQFHPEKSGPAGLRILEEFLRQ